MSPGTNTQSSPCCRVASLFLEAGQPLLGLTAARLLHPWGSPTDPADPMPNPHSLPCLHQGGCQSEPQTHKTSQLGAQSARVTLCGTPELLHWSGGRDNSVPRAPSSICCPPFSRIAPEAGNYIHSLTQKIVIGTLLLWGDHCSRHQGSVVTTIHLLPALTELISH